MTRSLMDVLTPSLGDLHESVASYLDDAPPGKIFGDAVDQLRLGGTGKSLLTVALLNDLLSVTEILLRGRWHPLETRFARSAVSFFQSSASLFFHKGLEHYRPYCQLRPEDAGTFLEFHATCPRPFGGRHFATKWSGMTLCENVAVQFQNVRILAQYEQLVRCLLKALAEQVLFLQKSDARKVLEFVGDRFAHSRDQARAQARSPIRNPPLAEEPSDFERLMAELKLERLKLAEREYVIEQEWERLQMERAQFEQLRNAWEVRVEQKQPAISDHHRFQTDERPLIPRDQFPRSCKNRRSFPGESDRLAARFAEEKEALESSILLREPSSPERDCVQLIEEPAEKPRVRPPENSDHVLFDMEDYDGSTIDHKTQLAEQGAVVLWEAITLGEVDMVKAALNWGLDLNVLEFTDDRQSPLHLAAKQGQAQIVEALLKAGANPLVPDAHQQIPLETAILHEQPASARVLISLSPQSIRHAYPNLLKIVRDKSASALSRELGLEAISASVPTRGVPPFDAEVAS